MRKSFIVASLFVAVAAHAAQNDAEQQRQVLVMEGVGQVLPAATPAKPALAASGLYTQPTLKTGPSREAVVAELARARAAGELDFARAEIGYPELPPAAQASPTRLARLFKR